MVRTEGFDGFYEKKSTSAMVYSKNNLLQLRNWHWEDYKVIFGG